MKSKLTALESKRKKLLNFGTRTIRNSLVVLVISTLAAYIIHPIGGVVTFVIVGMLALMTYGAIVSYDYNKLTDDYKKLLLDYFINTYHPDIEYKYSVDKGQAKQLLKSTNKVKFDYCYEQDVITGSYKGKDFYISEVTLEKKRNDNNYTIFSGLFFQVKLREDIPKSVITTKKGVIDYVIGKEYVHRRYGFNYSTEHENDFQEKLSFLFPFIKHLVNTSGHLHILMEGGYLSLLLETKDNLFDTPKLRLEEPFGNSVHKNNFGRQLNSIFYILDNIINLGNSHSISENLELRALEMLENLDNQEKNDN